MRRRAFHGLHVAHSIPGRTRLKFVELKRQPHRYQALHRTLASIPGVHHVDVSSQTGSVVLHHDKTAIHSMQFLGAIADVLARSVQKYSCAPPKHPVASGCGPEYRNRSCDGSWSEDHEKRNWRPAVIRNRGNPE